MSTPRAAETALARIRKLCAKLEGVEEKLSHGAPAFFAGKKQFLHFWNNHHGDGRLAIWCRADPDARDAWLQADPQRFFLPPYVAHLGWVGIRLEGRAPWKRVEAIVAEAARMAARKAG